MGLCSLVVGGLFVLDCLRVGFRLRGVWSLVNSVVTIRVLSFGVL